jgi:hypothetical protein
MPMIVPTPTSDRPQFRRVEVLPGGQKKIHLFFHRGQARAWASTAKIIALIMGFQSGKTAFGAEWLKREIDNTYNENDEDNDYLAVSATFKLMKSKMLKELHRVFEENYELAKYKPADQVFDFYERDSQIFMRSAHDPFSLESATAKAAWLDEAGQFPRESWEASQRRLFIYGGRTLITTTPYSLNWLKSEIYDRWKQGDPDIEVIQEASTVNPAFPKDEFDKAKKFKARWYFNMMFLGKFDKPAAMIYDQFDSEIDVLKEPIELPANWPRYQGVDFAGPNGITAALWYAYSPVDGDLYLYDEYKGQGNAAVHVSEWKKRQVERKESYVKKVGGSRMEEGWREDYTKSGWSISAPNITDVEVGIGRVYAYNKTHKMHIFPACTGYISEKQSYCREVDENGDPTDKIADKQSMHYMDAERYIVSEFNAEINPDSGDEIQVMRWRR